MKTLFSDKKFKFYGSKDNLPAQFCRQSKHIAPTQKLNADTPTLIIFQ